MSSKLSKTTVDSKEKQWTTPRDMTSNRTKRNENNSSNSSSQSYEEEDDDGNVIVVSSKTTKMKSHHELDYDDCQELVDELRRRKDTTSTSDDKKMPIKEINSNSIPSHQRVLSSPMKRNNESMSEESPKKRIKMPQLVSSNSEQQQPTTKPISSFAQRFNSPARNKTRTNSLSENTSDNKRSTLTTTIASTPKSERKVPRVKEIVDSAAVERNMSNSWGDIIEELEEQSKELNEYVDKVATKYKIEKETLLKNVETDTEVLRKRQKRINFGKVTPEYQRYILAMKRKERKAYHPRTPNKFRKCSRRKFDGCVKKWRKLLHAWDENPEAILEYKNSLDQEDDDERSTQTSTSDFGVSNITASNFSYIVDDYDIIDELESKSTKTAVATANSNNTSK